MDRSKRSALKSVESSEKEDILEPQFKVEKKERKEEAY